MLSVLPSLINQLPQHSSRIDGKLWAAIVFLYVLHSFRQRYSRSLSLKYCLVWVSAFCLTDMLQPQFLFYVFEFAELVCLQSSSLAHIPLYFLLWHLGLCFPHFFATWLFWQGTVSSLVTFQLFQFLCPQIFCGDGTVTLVFVSWECTVCHLTAFSIRSFHLQANIISYKLWLFYGI